MPVDPMFYTHPMFAIQTEFAAGFKRSKRGNLYRTWGEMTVSVFQRDSDARFAWCIAVAEDKERPRYSRRTFEYEADALVALAMELGQGDPCPVPSVR